MSRPVHSPVRPRPAAPDRHLESPKPPRGPRTSLREAQARPRRLPRPPTRPFAARLQAPTCTPLSPDREGPPKAAHSSVRPPPSGARSTPPDPETAAAALEHALQRRGTALEQHLTRAQAPSPRPQTGSPSRRTGEALSPYRGRSPLSAAGAGGSPGKVPPAEEARPSGRHHRALEAGRAGGSPGKVPPAFAAHRGRYPPAEDGRSPLPKTSRRPVEHVSCVNLSILHGMPHWARPSQPKHCVARLDHLKQLTTPSNRNLQHPRVRELPGTTQQAI